MENGTQSLFVEINESNYVFAVVEHDNEQNIKIQKKLIVKNDEFKNRKFLNIDSASRLIKENVQVLEKDLNNIFKNVTIILDNFDFTCINISGFKKLNGSQILKDNISFIINTLKQAISKIEEKKTIIHIFNSKSILDGTRVDNLPIGLFGDFYSHQLTFYLIKNNDLKNIRYVFNKNNLNIKKILLKSYCEDTLLIDTKKEEKSFLKIKINKDYSSLSLCTDSAPTYLENFNFGTNIIFKDIEKVCSIKNEMIKNIFLKNLDSNDNEFVEKEFFVNTNYRKIRKDLIREIVKARVEEISDIIFSKNINLENFHKRKLKTFIFVEDNLILKNFKDVFKIFFSNSNSEIEIIKDFEHDNFIRNAVNLSLFGWTKEAVPITQNKNSLITRIFKTFFG